MARPSKERVSPLQALLLEATGVALILFAAQPSAMQRLAEQGVGWAEVAHQMLSSPSNQDEAVVPTLHMPFTPTCCESNCSECWCE